MKQREDLTRAERLEIGILLKKKYSLRSIAREMGRSPNTISYEIAKNSVRGEYQPLRADQKARVRKRMRKLQWSKIEAGPETKAFVIEKLQARWNPDEIAGYLKRTKDKRYVSKTAIYDWLRTSRGERYCTHLYSQRKRAKKRTKKTKKVVIPNRVGIERRTADITNRKRYGDWERDTVLSKKGCPGGTAMHQERKSRFVVGKKVRSMCPGEHTRVTRQVAAHMRMKSATMDNGFENRDHEDWGIRTFFCDPYSSWQKGSIENANKMFRMFFPKGTDFSTVTQPQIDAVCAIINDKPRKILGYRSSREIATKAKLFKIRVS
jgi:transposase, IS30 family